MSVTIKGTCFESEEEKRRKKGREGDGRRERDCLVYTSSARQKHGSMLVQHQLFHKKCIKLVKLLLKNG